MSSADTSMRTEPKQEDKVASEQPQVAETQQAESASNTEGTAVAPEERPPADQRVEIDDGASDSGVGTDYSSDSTSIASSMMQGYLENGRRYQGLREGDYWAPCDEKQLESQMAAHLIYKIMDSKQANPLFRSPIGENPQNILDIGTGNGEWARDVADRYPSASVVGIDLHPPPDPWVPPNCKFEVDDALKVWIYPQKFDLIHMRELYGSFSEKQWRGVYKQAYNNLLPGGWIEQTEAGMGCYSDDNTFPPNSHLASWRTRFTPACDKMGKPINIIDTIKSSIEAAGFINVQEKWYKVPLGDWAKNPLLKEAGRLCKRQFLDGMEGYTMFVLTKFGDPEPWQPAEVQVFLAEVRKEIDTPGMHAYYLKRRVWGQKPLLEGQNKTASVHA